MQKQEAVLLRRLTAISDKCPFGECDGDGYIISLYFENGQKVERAALCKCIGQNHKEITKKYCGIPNEYKENKLNDFKTDVYQESVIATNAKKAAVQFVKNYSSFAEKGKGLYFYSKTKGSGKTRLACSVGNALINEYGLQIRFTTTLNLLEAIKDTYNKNSENTERKIGDELKRSEVLIIDDIGTEKASEWVNSIFLSLLDYRISNNKPTIFTSNVAIEKLRLDDRIVDRIYKMAIEINLPEESIRRLKSREENQELKNILTSKVV